MNESIKNKIMKYKNPILFGILILFLVLTYFFEEKAGIDQKNKKDQEAMILDTNSLGEMKSLKGIKINIDKRKEDFYDADNGLLLSMDRMTEVFQILSTLRAVKILDPIEVAKVGKNHYIPDDAFSLTFSFERGNIVFRLGHKLEFDQSFYMEVIKNGESSVVVVNDISPDPGAYENEEDYKKSDAKYKRLQVVFLLTNKYFQDTEILRSLKYDKEEKINFESVTVQTFRNKKFTVNFKKLITDPAPLKGIGYFEENWLSFHAFLTNLNAQSVVEGGKKELLNEILSRFDVVDRKGVKYWLEVYKNYSGRSGYFLVSSLNSLVFELRPEDAKHFFVNVQDFWLKKIGLTEKMYNLDISFYDGRQNKVRVEDKQLFKVELLETNKAKSVRVLEFKKLIDFFKNQGDHVSDLDEKPSDILKESVLKVVFNNKIFNVILRENEAIVVDFENKIKIHYYVGSELPFSIKYDDYFLTK